MKTYKFTQEQLDSFARLMYVSGCLSVIEHIRQNIEADEDSAERTVTPAHMTELDALAEPDAYVMNDGIVNTLCSEEFEGVEQEEDATTPPEEWETEELYYYCQKHKLIADEEEFMDFMGMRDELLPIVKKHIEPQA